MKHVSVLRVRDGSVVSYPAESWAIRVSIPWHIKDRFRGWRQNITLSTWKNIPMDRPTGMTGGGSLLDTFRLRCAVPGQLVYLRTGEWTQPKGADERSAPAELFVVSGRAPESDATADDFLDRIVYGHWHKDRELDPWPPLECFSWEMSPYAAWLPQRSRKTVDRVSVLAGLPTFGKAQTVVELPGNMPCVPVHGREAMKLGQVARLQPLDTPGRVRLFSSSSTTLGGVWNVGSVWRGKFDDMLVPSRERGDSRVPVMGVCAYTPGYLGDMDAWGAIVLLFDRVRSTSFALPIPALKPDRPGYWQHTPVLW